MASKEGNRQLSARLSTHLTLAAWRGLERFHSRLYSAAATINAHALATSDPFQAYCCPRQTQNSVKAERRALLQNPLYDGRPPVLSCLALGALRHTLLRARHGKKAVKPDFRAAERAARRARAAASGEMRTQTRPCRRPRLPNPRFHKLCIARWVQLGCRTSTDTLGLAISDCQLNCVQCSACSEACELASYT